MVATTIDAAIAADGKPSTNGRGLFEARRPVESLLELDPDLASDVSESEQPAAAVAARIEVVRLPKGDWAPPRSDPGALGFLVVSGMLARIVRVGRRESLELVGPGDVIRPREDDEPSLLSCDSRWEVLEPVLVGVLDARFSRAIGPWPQIIGALAARCARRTHWLGVQAAIDAHPTVEERLMLMFCHLGERMGRVSPDGITLELPLSHRLLAQAVRALRPSVTSGLARLRDDGRLLHPARRRWVITDAGLAFAHDLCGRAVREC